MKYLFNNYVLLKYLFNGFNDCFSPVQRLDRFKYLIWRWSICSITMFCSSISSTTSMTVSVQSRVLTDLNIWYGDELKKKGKNKETLEILCSWAYFWLLGGACTCVCVYGVLIVRKIVFIVRKIVLSVRKIVLIVRKIVFIVIQTIWLGGRDYLACR